MSDTTPHPEIWQYLLKYEGKPSIDLPAYVPGRKVIAWLQLLLKENANYRSELEYIAHMKGEDHQLADKFLAARGRARAAIGEKDVE